MIKLRMGRIGPMASALRCGGLRTGRVATWPVLGPRPRQRGPRGGAARSAAQAPSLSGEGAGKEEKERGSP
jgi:hypothetical protein